MPKAKLIPKPCARSLQSAGSGVQVCDHPDELIRCIDPYEWCNQCGALRWMTAGVMGEWVTPLNWRPNKD